ncbi:MAG: hypothetical protein HY728_05950 [Candidatus Rokubacteria bacterium]|nr:hypothetical protein [Candidatus Rokubacteria bacterium]
MSVKEGGRAPLGARPRRALPFLVVAFALTAGAPGVPAAEGPPADRILPVDQYTSDKARHLATTYAPTLRELNAGVYHCLPWLEVQRQSIGFFRPKGEPRDDRYLSLRVYVEQDPSPQFAKLALEERAAAMFSRYVGPLLGRMARDAALVTDSALDGFTVILEWLKPAPRAAGERPVHETIAVFIRKSVAAEYLAGRTPVGNLAEWTRVLGWDGEKPLGPLKLTAWDDNFVSTYRVANYQADPGVSCR